jgi:cupin fold WbuC family metalloprotein
MKTIDVSRLDDLAASAAASERRRVHLNLHDSLEEPVQRLLIALEPGTYLRPHRHTTPPKWELFAVLRGALAVLTFDDDGVVLDRYELNAGATSVIEIPPGTWHTLLALRSSIVIEVKQGPYMPLTDKDFAAWGPAEGDAAAVALESWFREARPGQRAPR